MGLPFCNSTDTAIWAIVGKRTRAFTGTWQAWVCNIEGNADHEKLDKRSGPPGEFRSERYDDDEEESKTRSSGREIAVAKVDFPFSVSRSFLSLVGVYDFVMSRAVLVLIFSPNCPF